MRFLNIFPFILLLLTLPSPAQTRKASKELPPSAFQLISVQVSGTQRYKPEDIARASGLQLGQTVHENDFRSAAQLLLDTGAFIDVAYSFQYAPEGTRLELKVKDTEHFVPVQFENLVWFSDEELLEKLHAQVPLFNGQLPITGKLPDDVSEALQALIDAKKIPARVDYLRVAHGDGPTEAFAFSVSGPRITIGSVEFSGTDATKLPSLEAAAKRLRGAEYVRSALRVQADKNLLPVFLELGYLRAAFADPQAKVIQTDEEGILVDVTLPVNPGPQYTLAEVALSGNKDLPGDTLRQLIHVKLDQPADAIQLAGEVDSIKNLYGTRGYMDVSVHVAPELDDSQHTVKYHVTINEGAVYKMGDLEILGVDSRTKDRLQNNWTLLTGDIYNSGYTRRFVAQALKEVLASGEWNTDIQETRNKKDKTVDVTLHFIQKY